MIFFYTILCLLPSLSASAIDEDLIIERRPHHVDWEDLFMEYNKYSAPDRSRQEVNLTLEIIDISFHRVLFELVQTWRDERLRFVGSVRVPVPSHIQPWYPDTYIRNGWDVIVEQKSLELNYDGTFSLRQKYQATLDLNEKNKLDLTLVISSFNNYGTERINYNLISSKSKVKNYEHISLHKVSRKSDNIYFDDLHIGIHYSPVISQPTTTQKYESSTLAQSNNSTK